MNFDKYKSLGPEARKAAAYELHNSLRGSYIISQALYYAIEELEKAKHPEWSNI